MAGTKKAPGWRKVFLRALGRTGNARASACEAGIDVGTGYDHRIKDPGFFAQWQRALARAKATAGRRKAKLKAAGALVARKTRHGTQLIRSGPDRWSPEAEVIFFAELGRTACVQRAADACGFSTNALYRRRGNYPDFAERWRATEEEAKQRIPGLLAAATIASLDPDPEPGSGQGRRDRAPRVSIDQAIAIARLKCSGGGGGGRGGGYARREPSIEEVRDEVVRRIAAIRRHREEEGGEEGHPPFPGGEDR